MAGLSVGGGPAAYGRAADIKAAPELDERRIRDREYLETLGWHDRVRRPEGA